MPLFAFEGRAPRVDPTAFVAPTATLIGDVTVEAGASVWFNAVLRGDYGPIVVREGANVQDGSVLHAPPGIPVDIKIVARNARPITSNLVTANIDADIKVSVTAPASGVASITPPLMIARLLLPMTPVPSIRIEFVNVAPPPSR